MRKLAFLLLLIPHSCFTQTKPVSLGPNMTPVCTEPCNVVKVSDSLAAFQLGAGTTYTPLTVVPAPFYVNCGSGCTQFGGDYGTGGDPDVGVVKTLYAQERSAAYTITWTDSNNTSSTITIPAVTPPPSNCPKGTYWGIATGTAGETATVAPGTVYQMDPDPTCTTAPAQSILDVSNVPHLNILRTSLAQTVLLMNNGQPTTLIIDPLLPTPPSTQVSVQSITVVINSQVLTCQPATPGSGGTFLCTPLPVTPPTTGK